MRVRTGQFERGDDAVIHNLWRVDFPMPLARSAWDVFASDHGRGLDYVKSPCGPDDTQARFFLHVHPLRPIDLPAGTLRYANLDFGYSDRATADKQEGQLSEHSDSTCRAAVALPDFPIDFVRTGQFRAGLIGKRLWNVRIDFGEVERVHASPSRRDDA